MSWALPVFGLTGGIASGKSELLRCFERMGAHTLDADHLGHELLHRDGECREAVVRRFGTGVRDAAGVIDRSSLARIVFGDDAARSDLESILHPAIVTEAQKRVSRMASRRFDVVILEAALLFESGMFRLMLDSVTVVVSEEVQRQRLLELRHLTAREAESRMRAQWDGPRKALGARWVIANDGSIQELASRARQVLDDMRADPRVLAAGRRFG